MKKNTIISLIVVAGAFALISCQPTGIEQVEMPGIENGVRTFRAILESPSPLTKTCLGLPEDDVYPVYWSEHDSIKVFSAANERNDAHGGKMLIIDGAGTAEGVFSGSIPEPTEECKYYYAVYPYSVCASITRILGTDSESVWDGWDISYPVSMPLPQTQKYAPHSFAKDYNPAVAVTNDDVFRFRNACGLLQLNLTGDVKVGRIKLVDKGNHYMWGTEEFYYISRGSEFSFNALMVNTEKDFHVLYLDCGAGVQLGNDPTDFYLAIPEAYTEGLSDGPLAQGFTVTIYDENGVEVGFLETNQDNSIHRSAIRRMPVMDIRRQTFNNLSANGLANCYIARPDGGTYTFQAGYKGNSFEKLAEAAASADLMWEAGAEGLQRGDIINMVAYDGLNRTVTFRTGTQEGNALIVVRDMADEILWSWHIWVTDYDPETENDTWSGTGAVMMSRNLGAIGNPGDDEYAGLGYEWGRKDPFANHLIGGGYSYTPGNVFDTADLSTYELVDQNATLSQSIAHPNRYINNGPSWWTDAGIFPEKSAFDLWKTDKTKYDPCPAGWRVADYETLYRCPDRSTYMSNSNPVWGNFVMDESPEVWGYATSPNLVTGRYLTNPYSIRCQREGTGSPREYIDLSAQGTANCYIARAGQKYKFNATVKGNSEEVTGRVTGASVIWEDWQAIDSDHFGWFITNVYYHEGYVYFTVGNHVEGNCVIGIDDGVWPHGSNFGTNILWSWHIWVTDYNPASGYDLVTSADANGGDIQVKMMNRNLGALSSVKYNKDAMGLMYQWGRKDPFSGPSAYNVDSPRFSHGSTETSSAVVGTVKYAIQHPDTFIAYSDSESMDWLQEPDANLWGPEKTMFDPCPKGWKVPSVPVWNDPHTFTGEWAYGLTMNEIWYPAAGYRNGANSNIHYTGYQGNYWLATAHGNLSHRFHYDENEINLTQSYAGRAIGMSVRCVEE